MGILGDFEAFWDSLDLLILGKGSHSRGIGFICFPLSLLADNKLFISQINSFMEMFGAWLIHHGLYQHRLESFLINADYV